MKQFNDSSFVTLTRLLGLALVATLLVVPVDAGQRDKDDDHDKKDDPKGITIPIQITLPLVPGFFNGQRVFYITTEASDAGLAESDPQVIFAPGLANAIPAIPLFRVTNFNQPNILSAVPNPVGPTNTDLAYSPLWRINLVTWNTGATPRVLTSVAEVFSARSAGEVTVSLPPPPGIVVNCPVVITPNGHLPSTIKIKSKKIKQDD